MGPLPTLQKMATAAEVRFRNCSESEVKAPAQNEPHLENHMRLARKLCD
jgi:hypothetical protein